MKRLTMFCHYIIGVLHLITDIGGARKECVMNMRRSFLLLILVLSLFNAFALSKGARTTLQMKALSAAELEKQASAPTVEQALLRAAAAKLKQEKRPSGTVELLVVINAKPNPAGCYTI